MLWTGFICYTTVARSCECSGQPSDSIKDDELLASQDGLCPMEVVNNL